ncbi:MAG: ethanolamine ammonia-lyase subunit EutC [Oceanospirillales bacterium]|nr:ethanolamine ammonia-lyase subunit EutC [Oceanospirillales bacterium]
MSKPGFVTHNAWQALRAYTDARIGLGRAGISLPTDALLDFQLAHAQAQDAVHQPLDAQALADQLQPICIEFDLGNVLQLHSRAPDRPTYLQRPDLGRRLDESSAQQLRTCTTAFSGAYDLAIVVVDGLSSRAIHENASPFLTKLLDAAREDNTDWQLAPLSIVRQGRVAVGDEVGELLNARCVLVLIGERPGLSSPDSLGLYMTWSPRVGLTDASRNCISNVRKAGLVHADAVRKALYLLKESRRRQLSGVQLKERSEEPAIEGANTDNNFLITNLTNR